MSLDKVAFEAAAKAALQPVLDQFQVNASIDATPVAPDEDKFTVTADAVTPTA